MWTRWHMAVRPSRARAASAFPASLRRPTARQLDARPPRDRGLHVRGVSSSRSTEEQDAAVDALARARRCLGDLAHMLHSTHASKHLLGVWFALVRNEPAVILNGFLRPVGTRVDRRDKQSPLVAIPQDSLAVRMVPLAEMLERIQRGERHSVVEHVPRLLDDPVAEAAARVVPRDHVLLVSETLVESKIIWSLYQQGSHRELTRFVETFEQLRCTEWAAWSGPPLDDALRDDLVRPSGIPEALYIASLGHMGAHAKVLERFHQRGGDVSKYLVSHVALTTLLDACRMQQNGRLARDLVDQVLDRPTIQTISAFDFTHALLACVPNKEARTLERLQLAMHIYRRMVHDVGYILRPTKWSMLFNRCIYLSQHDLAMEIFRDYRAHGIAPFQHRFRQALRMACRKAQYETVVAMARTWIDMEHTYQRAASTEEEDRRVREAEAECLNMILREMLKGAPSRDHVEQVLALLETRGVLAGANVTARTITYLISGASHDDHLSPEAVLRRFLDLWARVPTAIQRTGFVLHLVLQECESRGWTNQYERVIEYALKNTIELPLWSTVQIMDRYAARRDFDDAIRLGELVLQPWQQQVATEGVAAFMTTPRNEAHSPHILPDALFESLLRCYLFRERYDDVVRVNDAFRLTQRRGRANPKLAAILQDARKVCDHVAGGGV